MPCTVAAKPFKALETKYGRDKLLMAWTDYCRSTDPKYMSVPAFVSKVGIYMPSAAVARSAREYVTEEDAKKFIRS